MRKQKAWCHCCGCGARAIIEKTAGKTDDYADVYYRCTRLECGHTWVMNLAYSHTLVPSGLQNGMPKFFIGRMRPEEKQLALELLQVQ
ncbi:ogr/Delta-like zinc finger family protein [Yersinia enterocolitica]